MRWVYCILCINCFLVGDIFAQPVIGPKGFSVSPKPTKKYVKLGDKSMAKGDYYGASLMYKKALNVDSTKLNVLYKYAESLRGYNEYLAAEWYYAKVFTSDLDKKHPECQFWLAMMQKYIADYREAKRNFESFYRSYPNKASYFSKKAKHEAKACEFAIDLSKKKPKYRVVVKNIGEELNTVEAEFSPVMLNDSTLFFSTARGDSVLEDRAVTDEKYLVQIHEAQYLDSVWEDLGMIDSILIDTNLHNVNGTFSKDQKRFYFSRCDQSTQCDIYLSTKSDSGWQKPVALNEVNLAGYTTTQPHVANVKNKEYLIFVSNRPRGKGKLDIWYSEIIKNGEKYGKAKRFGSKINSIDNEISPYYDESTEKFFFSSDWHPGLGGFDIFESKGSFRSMAAPKNLGAPYNTSVNDMYFSSSGDTTNQKGMLTSNRKGSFTAKGETCCNDIYSFKVLPPIPKPEPVDTPKADTLIVEQAERDSLSIEYEIENIEIATLEDLKKYLPVTLYFHNDEPNPRSWATETKKDYLQTYNEYTAMLPTYQNEYSAGLPKNDSLAARENIKDFFHNDVDKGVEKLHLLTGLLYKQLEQGHHIELTVKGYASPLAKTEYNVNLTLRRISSMINYMHEYKGGKFGPYIDGTAINGGRLTFVKKPHGEVKAASHVSDNFNDTRNSVYSRHAALERKIQILQVTDTDSKEEFMESTLEKRPRKASTEESKTVEQKTESPAKNAALKEEKKSVPPTIEPNLGKLTFKDTTYNFGTIDNGKKVFRFFNFTNTSKRSLRIIDAKSDCDCTASNYPQKTIKPGESGVVEINFNSQGKLGSQTRTVKLTTSYDQVIELMIAANVVPKEGIPDSPPTPKKEENPSTIAETINAVVEKEAPSAVEIAAPDEANLALEAVPAPSYATFKETSYDFGQIKEGKKVFRFFSFTNSSNRDLIINDAISTCECAFANYPKISIKPGASQVIEVNLHSAGQKGQKVHTITLTTNQEPNNIVLKIKADVIP